MKILCICEAGAARSVAMAFSLKYNWRHDALAASAAKNSPATMRMLCKWAEKIILMVPQFADVIPKVYRSKVTVVDIGPDIWGRPLCADLQSIVSGHADRLLKECENSGDASGPEAYKKAGQRRPDADVQTRA
jgi:hypothetical protein